MFLQSINLLKKHSNLLNPARRKSYNTVTTFLLYYPKEYALRESNQLYFFTSLHIVQNNPQIEQNQNVNTTKNTKTIQLQNIEPQRSNTQEPKIPQKERKNRK